MDRLRARLDATKARTGLFGAIGAAARAGVAWVNVLLDLGAEL